MQNVDPANRNAGENFGDYVPKRCLAEDTSTRTWLAEQPSVGRMVLIEELKPEAGDARPSFLADVRAKAAVEHPLVGSIYEACTEDNPCFFAHELLPGETLQQRSLAGEKFCGQRFVHVLRRIAEANIYLETRAHASAPFSLDAVHLDAQGVIRIKNLVIAGQRLTDHSLRDILKLGTDLLPLLDRTQQGSTRCQTLLAWMRGEETAQPLDWDQIRSYCEQIEAQLAEPIELTAPRTSALRPRKKPGLLWLAATLLAAITSAVIFFPEKPAAPPVFTPKPEFVIVAAGTYATLKINEFQISAYEVTIREYAEFLDTLNILAKDAAEKTYDHAEQPEKKPSHQPADWTALYRAAKEQTQWGQRPVDLDMPVVGVDWWDAYAYAKWKRADLPTPEQWLAALHASVPIPSSLPISDWAAVTAKTDDRTSTGLRGMAGSVSEWTAEPRPSPTNPLGKPRWVVIGGSYLKPGTGATQREWVDSRSY